MTILFENAPSLSKLLTLSVRHLCTGGLRYALSISMLISYLFRTKACMDGGEGQVSKGAFRTRYCWGGESEKVKLLYVLTEHRIQHTEIQIYKIRKTMYIKLPMYGRITFPKSSAPLVDFIPPSQGQ
jgi:hypothetical protein